MASGRKVAGEEGEVLMRSGVEAASNATARGAASQNAAQHVQLPAGPCACTQMTLCPPRRPAAPVCGSAGLSQSQSSQ
jgi:hypothetical protein